MGGHLSTHFLTEVRVHFNREMLCQMRTLSSETSFVEMGDEKFFKCFPKFGTKSYQKYLNCMEILWVNKHYLRRTYILNRSPFTENDISFWLQKLLL